ncbi:MAG TPA: C40 family peptidase [Methylovirgula sp.]
MNSFDPRTTPARADLAAAHLAGKIPAERYVEGRLVHLTVECVDLRPRPSFDASVDTQVLYGETATLYDTSDGWAWVQLASDNYVGYLPANLVGEDAIAPTHRVAVKRSFIYPRRDIKVPTDKAVPMGAGLRVKNIDGGFAEIDDGYVIASHLVPIGDKASDFVTVAESFDGAPYLWGGKTVLGIDCSGLVQIALAQSGIPFPRDTDLQQRGPGQSLPLEAAANDLRRGDLVFWKGHVGIMRDAATLLHANAHHMLVASEPLAEARQRILAKGAGDITALKRLI